MSGIEDYDVCACGDYRKQHEDGCFCGCSRFRIHLTTVHTLAAGAVVNERDPWRSNGY